MRTELSMTSRTDGDCQDGRWQIVDYPGHCSLDAFATVAMGCRTIPVLAAGSTKYPRSITSAAKQDDVHDPVDSIAAIASCTNAISCRCSDDTARGLQGLAAEISSAYSTEKWIAQNITPVNGVRQIAAPLDSAYPSNRDNDCNRQTYGEICDAKENRVCNDSPRSGPGVMGT
jgi:hypothetical protein